VQQTTYHESVTDRDRLFIGGDWVTPASDAVIEVVSPATEEVIARVPEASTADVDRAVDAARAALTSGPWPAMSATERADVMAALSGLLQARSAEIAAVITEQNGSPISWSIMGQVFSSTLALDYYADLARTFAFEERRDGMMGPVLVRREPVGVVGAIVPWNVPLFTTMLKLAPAMAAGCTVVLKPAPETPLDAYLLAECAAEAGVPPGVLNIVAAGREVGEHLVTHPGVDKIAFTGSTLAGRRIAALCGEQLKRCTLELGGKSAAVICADADLSTTIPGLLPASLMNNGQACVAQTRILVQRDRYDEAVDALTAAIGAMTVGDPRDPATEIGPLTSARQRERVEGYIAIGQAEGASVALGGGRPDMDRGWYVEPTVFAGVDNSMRIAQEEIFGPVLAVIPFDTEDEAIAIANDSAYGLSGSVWSADNERATDIARRIESGTVSVNGFMIEFCSPFGGYKDSGLGRELGPEGLGHYLEMKSIMLLGGDAGVGVGGVA
jgi:aldehyde dehydrogenase (NAD+)